MSLYDIGYTAITGEPRSLGGFRGQVLMIVNTASRCGFTGQYAGLERIYQQYRDRGFVIVGFPCNQFLGQEPGSDAEILAFCQDTYGVSFPLSEKIEVAGPGKHPLYAFLTRAGAAFPGKISWNFTKFLVDREGTVVARFGPSTNPESAEVRAAIERVL
ncbi:MAG: glutathione peroxidase [Planctomycetes bacterium]|nr:glutathione peroxidase [Planctomycetota bacterium]